jgi:hypothetical protein
MCFEHGAYFALANVPEDVAGGIRALKLQDRVGLLE